MAVLAPGTRRNVSALPRERRPARFVVETDWVLRTHVGPSAGPASFPAETRQLTREDVQAIWDDLRTAGLLDPAHPAMVAPAPTSAPGNEVVWVVGWTANGVRRTLAFSGDERGAARPLLDRLADLAWMPE
jgi:hypothetical protein